MHTMGLGCAWGTGKSEDYLMLYLHSDVSETRKRYTSKVLAVLREGGLKTVLPEGENA